MSTSGPSATAARRAGGARRVGTMVAVLGVGLVGGLLLPHCQASIRPAASLELCEALRSGNYPHMRPAGWRRQFGLTDEDLTAYVRQHCPDQVERATGRP